METVAQIIAALGGLTQVARETGNPVQTIHSWKTAKRIPRWHRPALIEVARRRSVILPNEAVQYLMGVPVEAAPAEA